MRQSLPVFVPMTEKWNVFFVRVEHGEEREEAPLVANGGLSWVEVRKQGGSSEYLGAATIRVGSVLRGIRRKGSGLVKELSFYFQSICKYIKN